MSKGGFFGNYNRLNPPPASEIVQTPEGPRVELDFSLAGITPVLQEIRKVLRGRFDKLDVDPDKLIPHAARSWPEMMARPIPPAEESWFEMVARWKLSDQIALAAWQKLNLLECHLQALEGSVPLTAYIADEAFWLGVLAQRVHLAPSEAWRRLTPQERQREGPRRTQRKRWAPHNTEAVAWRLAARRAWRAAPSRTIADVAREIHTDTGARWETVRKRIRDLKPAGQ